MLKSLAILTVVLAIAGSVSSQPNKTPSGEKGNSATDNPAISSPHHHAVECEGTSNQSKSSQSPPRRYAALKLLHWMSDSNWWLVIAAFGTALVIGWQSFATAKSAEAALLQIQMMKDKERARVEIKTMGLELEHESEEFWNLKATIELRNVGAGRAYVRRGIGNLIIADRDHEPPIEPDYWSPLNVVDGFIDPTGDSLTESCYFFGPEKAGLSEYSQKICDGKLQLYITGFIEYETVGTRFHRDFNYAWVGFDDPSNIGAMLLFTDASKPKTDRERISSGFWRQHQFRENGEYEMRPPKKTKKRPKAN